MKINEYGYHVFLNNRKPRYPLVYLPVNGLNLAEAACKTNMEFLTATIYIHTIPALTVYISKSKAIYMSIIPMSNFLGHTYTAIGNRKMFSTFRYPERNKAVEKCVDRIRKSNIAVGSWKVRIKFDNVAASWESQQKKVVALDGGAERVYSAPTGKSP